MLIRRKRKNGSRNLRNFLPSCGRYDDNLDFDYDNFNIENVNTKITRILKKNGGDVEAYEKSVRTIIQSVDNIGNDNLRDLFIEMVSKFSNINIRNMRTYDVRECSCGTPFELFSYVVDGYGECPECELILFTNYKEGKETSTTIDDLVRAFLTEFDTYCGNKIIDFDMSEIFNELDEYMSKYNYPTRETALNTEPHERPEGTCLSYVRNALNILGYKKYSKFSMIIARHYWGWSYPQVHHLRDEVTLLYRKIQIIYRSIPSEVKGRSSNLPNQYLLYKILHMHGADSNIDDFSFSKKKETLVKLDKIYEMVCEAVKDERITFYRTI